MKPPMRCPPQFVAEYPAFYVAAEPTVIDYYTLEGVMRVCCH
jgi:hypothetical protein